METKIPGISAAHRIVTPACRSGHGPGGARMMAIETLTKAYDDLVGAEANQTANFHFVLTVEHDP